MNRRSVLATLVAIIGAMLSLQATSALAGKPAPSDPCAGATTRGFPAVVFTRQRTTSGHVWYDTILADKTGQCQQTVLSADGFAPTRPGADVNLRYDPGAGTDPGKVLIVRGATMRTLAAYQYSVSFDQSGVPTTAPVGSPSTILDLDSPSNPFMIAADPDGWSTYVLANPLISPDGTKLLVTIAFRQFQGTVEKVRNSFWTCPFNSSSPVVDASTCQMVYLGLLDSRFGSSAGWGGRSDAVFVTDTSPSSNSSNTLSRVSLPSLVISAVWSRGTNITGPKGWLDVASDREMVAVYEAGQSGCSRVLVLGDAGTCGPNNCQILNGAGAPSRSLSWLPDGRMAGEGQTAPNRKGQCSASGSIVVFDPLDPNGSTTTITPSGSYPDGAGGG